MAAFSRGFTSFLHQHSLRLPSSVRATIFSPRPQYVQSRAGARFFSSSFPRKYQYPTAKSFISSDPVLRTVSQKRESILLYQEPKSKRAIWGTYALACSCVAGGLYTWKFRVDLPDDLPFFVGPTYNVVGAIFFAVAFYVFTWPVRRISTLEIIPGSMGGPVQLRIRARISPWQKERVILANMGEATISEKTAPMVAEIVEAERARRQNLWDGLENMFIAQRIWEFAARWVEQKWTSFFLRFKFTILRFGIAKIDVQGEKWKIDCSGWLREDGQAIDRIISEV